MVFELSGIRRAMGSSRMYSQVALVRNDDQYTIISHAIKLKRDDLAPKISGDVVIFVGAKLSRGWSDRSES